MSQNEESKVSTSMTVLAEVADALAQSAPEVREMLKQVRLKREKDRRVDLLDKAMLKREQLQTEVYKIKPPVKKQFKLVDGQMQEVEAVFTTEEAKKFNEDTKQFNKLLKEASEKLQKFDAALEAAFCGQGFDKLSNLLGGKSEEVGKPEE